MGLIIRSSAIHAAGCYTTSPIASGTRVVEYTGPLIDKDEADRRYAEKPITYLFAIGDGTQVVDGHGMAMFINHSCDANCETEEIDGHVWITAIRDIAAGEELCYDYCLFDGDEDEAPCNCGARACRGSMFSPEELRRRKRQASKKSIRATRKPVTQRPAPGRHKKVSVRDKNRREERGAAGNRTNKKKSLPDGQQKKINSRKNNPKTIAKSSKKKSSKASRRA